VIVLLYGSRGWRWRPPIAAVVAELPEGTVVLAGGAPGADRMAALEAQHRGLHVATMPALWKRYGRRAGPLRNRAMASLPLARAYGFRAPGASPGTDDMTEVLRARGVPTELYHHREEEL
jgi:hypothetical protein